MRKIILLLVIAIVVPSTSFCQMHKLPVPDGWTTETFPFPISFAPGIPFTGHEELRFAPGWSDTTSVQLWSYCFLWWLDEGSEIDAASLKSYLEEYYSGLVKANIATSSSSVETKAAVTPTGDNANPFVATVDIYDFISYRPTTLNVNVSMKACPRDAKVGYFFSISPQPKSHPVWNDFQVLWQGFECGK
ncbi:MAG TPA: hypothetical protein VEB86_09175 [Chryseosolibacter sp.]|nr:hypothetical protein [Chryseosolibacter sp.]